MEGNDSQLVEPLVVHMLPCKGCGSDNLKRLRGEVAMRRAGLMNIDNPIVWVFPEVVVCMDCGVAQFVVPEAELRMLGKRGIAAERPQPDAS